MINLIENSTPVHADHVTGTGLVRVCHVSILSLILFAISSPMQGNISIFFYFNFSCITLCNAIFSCRLIKSPGVKSIISKASGSEADLLVEPGD